MTNFDRSMMQALRLTRTRNLAAATDLIQATLRGSAVTSPTAATAAAADPERVNMLPAPGDRAAAADGSQPTPGEGRSAGATFEPNRYVGAAGELDYRLYVPARREAGMPLVVMLHGCTQSAEDFARGTGMNRLAEEFGVLVAYPAQTQANHPQRCWNWFNPGHQLRDHGEPALIAGLTRRIVADQQADPDRVYVAGLSAGGAAAAIMGAVYPDLYAAIGVHSGLACGAARDLPGAMAAMRTGGNAARADPGDRPFVPIITFHGDRDRIVNEVNSRQIIAAASVAAGGQLRTRTEKGTSEGGRAYTRAVSSDASGTAMIEQWTIHAAGHAWAGGHVGGSYTDPEGPDASREMLRFFLQHRTIRP